MNKKEEYIDRLLNVIKSLEANVSIAQKEDTLSFSFFRDSFQKGQEISKLIHELEMLQIEDMKRQMEKLIVFLSEEEDKKQTVSSEIANDSYDANDSLAIDASNENRNEQKERILDYDIIAEDTVSITIKEEHNIELPKPTSSTYIQHIELPKYENPNINVVYKESVEPIEPIKYESSTVASQNSGSLSINDIAQTSHPKVDVKRGLSLNDRFYFQRELFNNNRENMNSVMMDINSLHDRESIEQYLIDNTSWNFENEDVKSFLDIVSKGLK